MKDEKDKIESISCVIDEDDDYDCSDPLDKLDDSFHSLCSNPCCPGEEFDHQNSWFHIKDSSTVPELPNNGKRSSDSKESEKATEVENAVKGLAPHTKPKHKKGASHCHTIFRFPAKTPRAKFVSRKLVKRATKQLQKSKRLIVVQVEQANSVEDLEVLSVSTVKSEIDTGEHLTLDDLVEDETRVQKRPEQTSVLKNIMGKCFTVAQNLFSK